MSSRGEQLQRAVAAQKNFRERAGRIPRHRRAAQIGVAEKIRLGSAITNGDTGTNCRRPRFRRQGGGGIEKVFGGAVNFDWPINQSPQIFSMRLFLTHDRHHLEWPSPSIVILKEKETGARTCFRLRRLADGTRRIVSKAGIPYSTQCRRIFSAVDCG